MQVTWIELTTHPDGRRTHLLASEIKGRTGLDTIHSDLTYDLRAGEPDTVDTFVSKAFGNIAMELLDAGQRGRMMAIRDGRYGHAQLPSQEDTAVSVDTSMYDVRQLRPRYDGLMGRPLMMGHSVDSMSSPYGS